MKNRTRKILILLLLVLCFGYIIVRAAQAAYESMLSSKVNNRLAGWVIKVNNNLISQTESNSTNSSFRTGKVGPGSTLTYPVTINATGTDVAIKFSLVINDKSVIPEKYLTLTDVTSSDITLTRTGETEYTGVILSGSTGTPVTIDLNFEWIDDGTLVEYVDDTSAASKVEINFNAIQYRGEQCPRSDHPSSEILQECDQVE